MVSAIEFHHKPEEYKGDEQGLTDLVAISDYIATRSGSGVMDEAKPVVPPDSVFERLNLQDDRLSEIWAHIDETLEATKAIASI